MFLEVARGTATGMKKLPRDARLPNGGRGWWVEDLSRKGRGKG